MESIVGKRVRLLAPMENIGSNWMPVEKLPVGAEGTITFITDSQIAVNWDEGSSLCLFPELDKYEIYE